MRIAIGSDHVGFELKQEVKAFLMEEKHEAFDVGTYSKDPVDYPDYAEAVGEALRESRAERGIILCGSGVGASMAANRIPGIRAMERGMQNVSPRAWNSGRGFCIRRDRPIKAGRTPASFCRSPVMMPLICPCRGRSTRSAWSKRLRRGVISGARGAKPPCFACSSWRRHRWRPQDIASGHHGSAGTMEYWKGSENI
jgi:hypothetical protein